MNMRRVYVCMAICRAWLLPWRGNGAIMGPMNAWDESFGWLWWALGGCGVLLLGWLAAPTTGARRYRRVQRALAAWVLLLPLLRWGLLRGVAWLYDHGPEGIAHLLMPSRQVLPLTHYQAAALGLWRRLVMFTALGVGGLLAVVGGQRPRIRRLGRAVIRHPLTRAAASLVFGATLVFLGFNVWLHIQFLRPHPVFYTGCRKIWGHRGHPEPPQIPENTIASYRRAFDLGAAGVEMDVRYDLERRRYFIGRYDQGAPPPPEQRLWLADVFAAVGQRGYFWLDIKTIHYLTPEQAHQAATDLAALLDAYRLRQRAIVESDTPENLRWFAQAGLHTSYWIFNIDESAFPHTWWGQWRALVTVKQQYIQGGFSAISLDRRFYTPLVAWMLQGARVHLFTVDSRDELEALSRRDQVRVILTNTTYYDISACP